MMIAIDRMGFTTSQGSNIRNWELKVSATFCSNFGARMSRLSTINIVINNDRKKRGFPLTPVLECLDRVISGNDRKDRRGFPTPHGYSYNVCGSYSRGQPLHRAFLLQCSFPTFTKSAWYSLKTCTSLGTESINNSCIS
jgi:hypothetical protein